jgi:hypothetical protein
VERSAVPCSATARLFRILLVMWDERERPKEANPTTCATGASAWMANPSQPRYKQYPSGAHSPRSPE